MGASYASELMGMVRGRRASDEAWRQTSSLDGILVYLFNPARNGLFHRDFTEPFALVVGSMGSGKWDARRSAAESLADG